MGSSALNPMVILKLERLDMSDITINQLETQSFFQQPKIFFVQWRTDKAKKLKIKLTSKYVKMGALTKSAYGMMYDRCQLSIHSYQNGRADFVDETGAVFMIYTVEDLMEILDCSKPTAIKIKKELAQFGLLREVRQGQNKPNRLYLQNVDAREQIIEYYDFEKNWIRTCDCFGNVIEEKKEEVSETLDISEGKNFGLPHNLLSEVKIFNPSNTDRSETELSNDTNRYEDESSLNQLSDGEAFQMGQHGFLSDQTIQRLSLFGADAKLLENKIYQAKRQVEKDYSHLLKHQEMIYGEVWSQELDREVDKLIFKVKTGEHEGKSIQNLPGYFYKMMTRFWKMALLIEKEQGFLALTSQSDYAKEHPEECPSLIAYYYPDKLPEWQLNQYLANLREGDRM